MAGGTKIYYLAGLKKSPRVGVFDITADSEPILDGWGWAEYWSCSDWAEWHKLNVKKYGKQKANQKFTQWWSAQDGTAGPYNWCKYNAEFSKYFAENGIDVGNVVSHIVTGADSVVTSTTGAATNLASGVENTAKTVKWLLPLAFTAAVIGAGYFAYKKYIK